jgi:hypothetical protein
MDKVCSRSSRELQDILDAEILCRAVGLCRKGIQAERSKFLAEFSKNSAFDSRRRLEEETISKETFDPPTSMWYT